MTALLVGGFDGDRALNNALSVDDDLEQVVMPLLHQQRE
jgi:hypothetical protein